MRVFSVANCYDLNCNYGTTVSTMWERLWKSKLHERLKIFIWRILADVIPTRESLNWHFDVGDVFYCRCGAEIESVMHLFKKCSNFRAFAFASK